MKTMKKVFVLLVAVCMMVVMCMPTMAANSDTYTISTNTNDTHTYSVYQIFTGDLSNGVLSNVKWGKNAKNNTATVTEGEAVPDSVLKALTDVNTSTSTDQQKLAVIEKYANLNGDAYGTITAEGSLSNVQAGYYLIKDTTTNPASGEEISEYVVAVVEDTTISPKRGSTTSQKKVKDVNDSTANSTTDWQDSADYDIGDDVPFQLKATITQKYNNYQTYKLTFHDKESAGLTFNSDSVKVYVTNTDENSNTTTTEITSGFVVKTTGLSDNNCTFEVQFTNLKNITSVKAGSVITVEYTSKLNSNAVIGSTGNPNESHITYSNNPNGNQEGTTPDDKVTVFTYKVIVNKVDQDKKALKGAGFTLYKKDTNGNYNPIQIGTKTVTGEDGNETQVSVYEITGADLTTFTWTGLDDGDYKLVETTTPAGYNTAADVEFTISATHETTSDNPKLTQLSGGNAFTGEVSTGALTTQVVNNAGSTLPSTGGIGTTIFYVVGTVLVVGAGVLLIVKKRMNDETE